VFSFYDREYYALTAAEELKQQGFKDITVQFVEAVYKQLKKEAGNYTNYLHDKAEKALYYTLQVDHEPLRRTFVWSDRFFFILGQSDDVSHNLELIDSYNDKSV
jgi:hypothetical protein